jgi:hypothetical protein
MTVLEAALNGGPRPLLSEVLKPITQKCMEPDRKALNL